MKIVKEIFKKIKIFNKKTSTKKIFASFLTRTLISNLKKNKIHFLKIIKMRVLINFLLTSIVNKTKIAN